MLGACILKLVTYFLFLMLLSIVRQDLLRLPLPLLSHVAFAEGGSSYTFKSGEFQM